MAINLDNVQFRAFVEFAANVSSKRTILKAENATLLNGGAPRKIVARGKWCDFLGNVGRGADNKLNNNDIRALFMETVLRTCGVSSEAQLPERVKTAMKLHDYNQGKPLTARRIIAVHKAIVDEVEKANDTVSVDRARTEVDNAVNYVRASVESLKQKSRAFVFDIDTAVNISDKQREAAVQLVQEFGAGMTDTGLRIFANYMVTAAVSGIYDDENNLRAIATNMSRYLKNARNFKTCDARVADLDAKMTKYWQSRLSDVMGRNRADKYDADGFSEDFTKDMERATLKICGQTFTTEEKKGAEIKALLMSRIANPLHRKAITAFMNQHAGALPGYLHTRGDFMPTTKYSGFNVSSVKGFGLVFSIDPTSNMFQTANLQALRQPEYILDVSEDGTKAKVTVRSSGDLKFRLVQSKGWSEVSMGTAAYDVEFEFDLSNPNKVKLTNSHFSQTLGL